MYPVAVGANPVSSDLKRSFIGASQLSAATPTALQHPPAFDWGAAHSSSLRDGGSRHRASLRDGGSRPNLQPQVDDGQRTLGVLPPRRQPRPLPTPHLHHLAASAPEGEGGAPGDHMAFVGPRGALLLPLHRVGPLSTASRHQQPLLILPHPTGRLHALCVRSCPPPLPTLLHGPADAPGGDGSAPVAPRVRVGR